MQEPDKAHDSGAIREDGLDREHEDGNPSNCPQKTLIPRTPPYGERNRIERCLNKLKHFRRLAPATTAEPSAYSPSLACCGCAECRFNLVERIISGYAHC
jgi:hypothetical protein